MEKKFIIKNIDKYKDIKLCKGLDLQTFRITKRSNYEDNANISIEKFKNHYFKRKDGTKGIFKTFSSSYAEDIREIRIYNELISKKLCNQIGLDCVEYEPAFYKDDTGLITYLELKKNEKLTTIKSFFTNYYKTLNEEQNKKISHADLLEYEYDDGHLNLKYTKDVLLKYKEWGYKIDPEEIINKLYKMMIFDFLVLQTDRNSTNINFVYNKENNSYKLYPLLDNEFAFTGQVLAVINRHYDFTINDFMKFYEEQATVFSVFDVNKDSKSFVEDNVNDLVKMAVKYKDKKKILVDCVRKIDINKAIKELENEGNTISKEYKQFITNVVSYTKNILTKKLNSISVKDEKKDENDKEKTAL